MPEMERTARIWRKPHHNPVLRSFEWREASVVLMGTRELCEEFRGELPETVHPLLFTESCDIREHLFQLAAHLSRR